MLASLQRVIAFAGTPVAAILAIGIVAEVVNLWRVEQTYYFSYVEAWHTVGLIDRWVLIGLGVKYLLYGLAAATILLIIVLPLFLLIRMLVRRLRQTPASTPSAIHSNHTIGWIQTS